MIKSEAKVCGKISRSAVKRTNKEGNDFLSFSIDVILVGRNSEKTMQRVSVSIDSEAFDPSKLIEGARVEAEGILTFKKRGDNLYFNLSSTSLSLDETSSEDFIKGTMEVKGGVGKLIESKTDKNGKPMLVFSIYSTDKNGDNFEFTWVRCVAFGIEQPEWLGPKCRVDAKGDLELSPYKDVVSLGCIVKQLDKQEIKSI